MPGQGVKNGKKGLPRVDRTPKMYIGGKQVRPDGYYTQAVLSPKGELIGQVGDGNRKDIREAVEAAHAAHTAKPGWAMRHGYNRSQILYFIGENLDARRRGICAAPRGDDRPLAASRRRRRWRRLSSGYSPTRPGRTSTAGRCRRPRCAASPWASTSRWV